jgi:hypothetical protein
LDTNANGKIDRITFSIENPGEINWGLGGAAPHGLSVTQNGSDIAIASVTISGSINANPVVIVVNLNEADTDLVVDTNGVTSNPIELIYTQTGFPLLGCDCIRENGENTELNAIATGDGAGAINTEIDAAAPVIVTTSPANGENGVSVTASAIINWSEAMSLTGLTFTDSMLGGGGCYNPTLTNGDRTINIAHTGGWSIGSITYTITAAQDAGAIAFAAGSLVTHPWTFSTESSGRSGWWMQQHLLQEQKKLEEAMKQEASETPEPVVTDQEPSEDPLEEVIEEPVEEIMEETQPVTHPYGDSLIKVLENNAVYYVDPDGFRHVFINQAVYATWYGTDFSQIVSVSIDDLQGMRVGEPMSAKPGTLVTTPGTNDVFVVTGFRTISLIENEEMAETGWGQGWQTKVIDLNEADFSTYTQGPTYKFVSAQGC